MVRKAREMSPIEVRRLKGPGRFAVGGVAGLYLYLNDAAGSSWVLRVTVNEVREYMGLGPYPEVGLGEARTKAKEAKESFKQGINPKLQRKELASELKAKQESLKTFAEAASAYIDAHGDSWKSEKHRAQWRSTLETYVYPVFGDLYVKDVGQEQVMRVLEPIWKTKNETASRLRGRIESVLDWAKVRGYRAGDNPAGWKGHLDKLLPAPNKVAKVKHHRAVPFAQMPEFMKALRSREGFSPRALEFAILCAARSGEVRGALWSEIDFDEKMWIVPADRMKAGKEHRVPLSRAALRLLKSLPRMEGSDHVFPGRLGGELSDMSLSKVTRDMAVDAVPHGFRSTFRDWVGDATNYPRDLVETALAHTLDNKTEAAYRRGDALEKRRVLMADWDAFLSGNHLGDGEAQSANQRALSVFQIVSPRN